MTTTNTTYSFADVTCVISHDLVGQKSVNGEGLGKITVSYLDNLTESDLGADGAIMVTKVESSRAKITIEVQQTSSVNAYLIKYANAVRNAPSGSWAKGSIAIKENFDNGIKISASYCSLIKRPDRSDAQQGDHVTWEFLSTHTEEA
jgi:hypothetical protein